MAKVTEMGSKDKIAEVEDQISELNERIRTMKAEVGALERVVNRLIEVKWLTGRYSIDPLKKDVDSIVKESLDVLKSTRARLELLEEKVDLLMNELNKIRSR